MERGGGGGARGVERNMTKTLLLSCKHNVSSSHFFFWHQKLNIKNIVSTP